MSARMSWSTITISGQMIVFPLRDNDGAKEYF